LFSVASTRRPTSSVIAGRTLGSGLNAKAATVVSIGVVVDLRPAGMAISP
jgi:hypothetical protein